MLKQNLHTHTSYDHGKDTVEEMIQAALDQGFTTLGFSGHGTNKPLAPTSMSSENQLAYKQAIREAKEKYKDQIDLFMGIEQDSMAPFEDDELDYKIGSVHYMCKDGRVEPVDDNPKLFEQIRDEMYDGSIEKMVTAYYQSVEDMMDFQNFDIVGHIDLISKFNENEEYFGFEEPWYLEAAFHAIQKGIDQGLIFEMNTGAVARGNRKTAYPSDALLQYMADHNAMLVVDTDCHDRKYLDCLMDESIERARKAGFRHLMRLSKDGFVPEPIENFQKEARVLNPKRPAGTGLKRPYLR
ncbi:histidinol-phosphatase [Erysipelotrichaceae bacterium RD49]|nr:histidinol-phosphatase [Erysipelotrichaceae bacterium RD49]